MHRIEVLFANFFRGSSEKGPKYHWVRSKFCCLPIQESGLGIRSIEDISTAFAMKAWWNFRAAHSLWAEFKVIYIQNVIFHLTCFPIEHFDKL